jgi:hypothetical protein
LESRSVIIDATTTTTEMGDSSFSLDDYINNNGKDDDTMIRSNSKIRLDRYVEYHAELKALTGTVLLYSCGRA